MTSIAFFPCLLLIFLILEQITSRTDLHQRRNHHHSSNKGKKTCCLIVSVDNRALNRDVDAKDYPSLTSVLNHDYAVYHNYDYVYFQNNLNGFVEETATKYPDYFKDPYL
jgi:hypothetical protein